MQKVNKGTGVLFEFCLVKETLVRWVNMLIDILFLVALFVIIPTAYAGVIGAPLVATSKSRVKEIIEQADIREGERFYELGAGTGRMMIAAAKIAGAHVVGFELSPIFYCLAWLNLKMRGVKNHRLFLKNFFKADLKEADVVFCFLMPKSLEKLRVKLEKELKPGARVISFNFEIQGWGEGWGEGGQGKEWNCYKKITGGGKPPVYFYRR